MGETGAIGVGIVGYGLAGRTFHAPFIGAVDGLRIAAIATSDAGRQAQARAEHPDAAVVDTVDALLDRSDVEVVVVAAPNRSHVPLGIRALEAGRHTVVDKPIAMDLAEADRLLAAGEKNGRILTVYQNRRWDGDFQTARSVVESGRLGEIDSLEARFERWALVGPQWRETAEESGGPHRDLGAHLVDQSLLLFGPVRRVFAQIDGRRAGTAVEDSVFLALDHASGVRSRIWTSLIASRIGPRFRVRGSAGEYLKQEGDPQEEHLLAGMGPGSPGFGEEAPERWGCVYTADGRSEPVPTVRGDYTQFYSRLRDAVRGDGPPPVDPMDSVRALRVLVAAERSAASGAVETLAAG
ncbi:MAG TPA: Gfo/Idh/MocA family oxidoreductase [Candidatus Limnocylindrales bacterium]